MKREVKVEGITDINPNSFGGNLASRAVAIKASNFDDGIDTIATTEAPAMVVDWQRWQVVREILPMRYMEAPNNDKVPLLDSHSRGSVDKVKGSASGFRPEGQNLVCKTYVSASEPIVRQKIEERHIDSVSIGYMTDPGYTVEIPKGADVVIDGQSYRNDFEDGIPLLVRTWWKVHELSLVPIGADEAAKFKSASAFESRQIIEKIESLQEEIKQLKSEGITKEDHTSDGAKLTYHEARARVLKYV